MREEFLKLFQNLKDDIAEEKRKEERVEKEKQEK